MRALLAICAVLLAVDRAIAADLQPLWEIDTATEKLRPLEVLWGSFSSDDKHLVARVEYVERKKTDELGRYESLFVWDASTRKEQLNLPLGRDQWIRAGHGGVVTDSGTVLVAAGSAREIRFEDGKDKEHQPFKSARPNARTESIVANWFNTRSGVSAWLREEPDSGPIHLSVGALPQFEAKPTEPMKWLTTTLPLRKYFELRAVAVDPNLGQLAVSGWLDDGDRGLKLLRIKLGETLSLSETATVHGYHPGPITAMAFSPDSKVLATGSGDSSICLWDVTKAGKDWKPFAALPGGKFTVVCLAFSPDGRTAVAGTLDWKGPSNLFFIDTRGGKLVAARRLKGAVTAVAYSHDGKLLVTGNSEGKVQVWDAAAMRGD